MRITSAVKDFYIAAVEKGARVCGQVENETLVEGLFELYTLMILTAGMF